MSSSPFATPDSHGSRGPLSDRFSRDLAEIRRLTRNHGDDDSSFARSETESNLDVDDYTASGDEGRANEKSASKEDLDPVTYSTLSKRADFILANAKKKLNVRGTQSRAKPEPKLTEAKLLEGNLGRARHSLLVSPQNMSELRTQSSLSSYAPASPLDEEGGSVRITPRFNFHPPRQSVGSAKYTGRTTTQGHTRMYSDTSVPLPGGQAIKGARSLDQMSDQNEIHFPSRGARTEASEEGDDEFESSTLESVEEVEEAEKRQSIDALRALYGAISPTPKSTQELRDQAEELRNRIAYLQKKSTDDSNRTSNRTISETTERAFQTQVNALQKSLEDQERVIEELESAERTAAEIENDPRGEWHQVLSRNQHRDDDEEEASDEYFEYDDEYEDGEVPDALEDEDLDESQPTAGAHEDREDAFDYEHFILHSGMVLPSTRTSSSDGSIDSQSTERGPEYDDEDTELDSLQRANASSASLATTRTGQSFETAHEDNDSSSDAGSDGSDHEPPGGWPMPPAANGHSSHGSDVPTPRAGGFPRETEDRGVQAQADDGRRPLSKLMSLLMAKDEASKANLDGSDEELVRTTAASFRQVCQDLSVNEMSTKDTKALRERLEVAKRVLNGEL